MTRTSPGLHHNGRIIILRTIGVSFLLTGFLAALLGPIEMFCFYLFSEGGVFHYEGFGFGSFMFGNLAAQIMGYYFIAAVLIPLGYGTLRLQSWARHLTLAAIRFWIVAGLPLIIAFFFVLVSSKDIPLPVAVLAASLLAASYLLLPPLAIRFYENRDTRLGFTNEGATESWIETIPVPALALSYVFSFFLLVLHAQIFFNCMFPLFGTWVAGLTGIVLIDVSIISLALILWGIVRTKRWAWWCVLAYVCIMAFSYVVTFLASSWMEILSAANLPPSEMQILDGMPLHGHYFAILVGLPFLLSVVLIVRSRSCFNA